MPDYLMAICTSGHLIDFQKAEDVAISQMNIHDVITPEDLVQPKFSVKYSYCPDCGGLVITQCPECKSNIQVEYEGPHVPDEDDSPDFCYGCGSAFPWISTVEEEKQRSGKFIDIGASDIDGHFYPGLIYEINLCYQVQADQATLVLNRKLMECLLVDILRSIFPMDRLELFFDEDNNQTWSLSKLIQNLKSERRELRKYASNIDEAFFRTLEDMKYRGDASAHAIEEDLSQIDLSEKSDQATAVAKILFRLRTEAKTAHRG